MGQAFDEDFSITVQPSAEGGWTSALVDIRGGVWPVGLFANADVAVRSALRARNVAVSQVRPVN